MAQFISLQQVLLMTHVHLHSSIYESKIHQMTEGYKTCHNNITVHTENMMR